MLFRRVAELVGCEKGHTDYTLIGQCAYLKHPCTAQMLSKEHTQHSGVLRTVVFFYKADAGRRRKRGNEQGLTLAAEKLENKLFTADMVDLFYFRSRKGVKLVPESAAKDAVKHNIQTPPQRGILSKLYPLTREGRSAPSLYVPLL